MPNINITVREKIAHTISDTCIVCGNSDYVAIFDFDAEWDAYEVKTARFIWGGTFTDVPFAGNECPVPVIPDAVSVLVGVYAGDLHTTTAAAVGVRRSILGGSETEAEVSHEIKDAFGKMLAGKIDAPQVAQVGEVLTVEAVDADGKPTKWKTAPAAAEQKQANWAQNDETAVDYILNRPGGYYGDPVETEVEVYSGILKNAMIEDPPFTLVAGNTYKVTIDGATQQYVAFADEVKGTPCATIGTAAVEEALGSENGWAIAYAEITEGSETVRLALITGTGEFNGKAFAFLGTKLTREVHKIPAELLDIPPVEQVVTVKVVERDGRLYGTMTFREVLAAQRSGKEVRLLDGSGHYYQFTSIYSAGERIDFHSFWHYTLWWATMYTDNSIEFSEYNIGQQELTYHVINSYTTIDDSKDIPLNVGDTSTRIKLFVTISLISTTAGAYVQLRYYKGTKTLKLFGHENIGTTKATLYIELEKTKTNDTTFLTTLRLLNEDGTLHAANYYFSGELDLNDGDTTYPSPKIEIISGTEDKFAARQNVRKYYR